MMWRIYYGDGSVYDYRDTGKPEAYGVIAILQRRYDGRCHITSQSPYYIYDGEEWLPSWINDVEDYLAHGIPIKRFLVGRIVSKRVFNEVFERAKKDRDSEALD